jgi:hypothetical protein
MVMRLCLESRKSVVIIVAEVHHLVAHGLFLM